MFWYGWKKEEAAWGQFLRPAQNPCCQQRIAYFFQSTISKLIVNVLEKTPSGNPEEDDFTFFFSFFEIEESYQFLNILVEEILNIQFQLNN